jgi:release factor glutamine methyltransferase
VGSGAVVVALAKELPQFRWLGIDISAAALTVARENVRRQGVADRITLVQADLLAALRPGPRFALMVANLPYVPTVVWEKLPKDIKDFEPAQALKGGADGLDLIRRLIGEASNFLAPEGCLALEVGEGHAPLVMGLLREAGSYGDITAIRDYQRVERVVRARRK